MKLLLITNDDGSNGGTLPNPGSNFTVNFNSVIELPTNCEICILSYTLDDINRKKIHYLEVSNLPINTKTANIHKGQVRQILGPMVSNGEVDNGADTYEIGQYLVNYPIWVDLDNQAPIQLTSLNCKITNQNGVGASGLSTTIPTEILLGYRQKRM